MGEAKSLNRIGLHLSKKSLETHLDAFPRIFKLSWKHDSIAFKQPLPNDFTFHHSYMACLWRLGTCYVEVLGRITPRLPFPLVKKEDCEFSEVSTLFLTGTDQEILERYTQKKRLHYLCDYPALVQESIQGLMSKTTTLPQLSKTMTEVQVLHEKLSFLPQGITGHLEFHTQKIKLQKRWAMPGRVLKSLDLFLPSPPMRRELPSTYKERAEVITKGAQQSYQRGVHTIFTAHKKKDLDNHLERKCHQINFLAFPSPSFHSQEDLRSREGNLISKLLHDGQKSPTSGNISRFFLPPPVRDLVEWNVKHEHLGFLWGLPQKHTLGHTKCSSIHIKQGTVQFQSQENPFLQKEGREQLKHQIKEKRLQHFVGAPSTPQNFLNCFIQPALKKFEARRREGMEKKITLTTKPSARSTTTRGHVMKSEKELPLLAEEDRHCIEFHIQHKKIQHEWGLPVVVQRSLHAFAPFSLSSASGGIADTERWQEKRAGPQKHWKVKEVDFAIQASPLSATVKEHLEGYVKNLPVEQRWYLLKLLLESMSGFLPQVDEERRHLVYNHLAHEMSGASTQTETETESISGSEVPCSYHSELFPEVIRDREMSSWMVKEEPTFCPVTKCQHSQGIEEIIWKDGREIGQRRTLDKKRALDFHLKKTMPTMKSMVPRGAEPCTPFPSLSSPGMRRYSYNTSHGSEMTKRSQNRYLSVRSFLRSKGRKLHPCSSKGSLKKKTTHWQLESTFKTRAADSYPTHKQKAPQSPEDSHTAWKSVGSCKASRCTCDYHLSCSQAGSTSLVESTVEQRREKEEANTNANKPKESSYFFSKENETSILSSANQGEEGSSSPPSEDNGPHSSGSTTEVMEGFFTLPPGEYQPHKAGSPDVVESSFSSFQAQHHEFHTSSTATQGQKSYSSLLSKDSESEYSSSSSGKGQTDLETSQPLGEDMVQSCNTLVYQEAQDTTIMQSPHVVESNSSYEDIVVRHKETVPRSREIQCTHLGQGGSEPECEYDDPEVDEEVPIPSSILEKNPGFMAGYEAWKQGILNYSPKERREVFLGEIIVPAPIKGEKVVKLRAIKLGSGDHALATKQKEKIRSGTTKKGPKTLCAAKEPSAKHDLSPAFQGRRQREEPTVEGLQPKKEDIQDHEQKSNFGNFFNTKLGRWLKKRIWRRGRAAGPPVEGAKSECVEATTSLKKKKR